MSHIERVYARKRKSLFVAYLFWLFFGGCGAHRYYLKRFESALSMSVLMGLAGFCLLLAAVMHAATMMLVGSGLLALTGAWLMADIILIPFMARAYNKRLDNAMHHASQAGQAGQAPVRLG